MCTAAWLPACLAGWRTGCLPACLAGWLAGGRAGGLLACLHVLHSQAWQPCLPAFPPWSDSTLPPLPPSICPLPAGTATCCSWRPQRAATCASWTTTATAQAPAALTSRCACAGLWPRKALGAQRQLIAVLQRLRAFWTESAAARMVMPVLQLLRLIVAGYMGPLLHGPM